MWEILEHTSSKSMQVNMWHERSQLRLQMGQGPSRSTFITTFLSIEVSPKKDWIYPVVRRELRSYGYSYSLLKWGAKELPRVSQPHTRNSTTRGFRTISRIRSSNWDPKKTPTLSRIAQHILFQSPYHLMIRIETPSKHQFLVGCFQKFIQVQLWPDFMMITMFELPSKASFPCAPPIYGDCGDALWLALPH
jgi:hypothetical protein